VAWFDTPRRPDSPGALLRTLRVWSLRAGCLVDLERTFLAAGLSWETWSRVRASLWRDALVTLDASVPPAYPVESLDAVPWISASFADGSLVYAGSVIRLAFQESSNPVAPATRFVRALTGLGDEGRPIAEHLLTHFRSTYRSRDGSVEFSTNDSHELVAASTRGAPLPLDRWIALARECTPDRFHFQLKRVAPDRLDAAARPGGSFTLHLHAPAGAVVADLLPLVEQLTWDDVDELRAETEFGSLPVRRKPVRTQFRAMYDRVLGARMSVWADTPDAATAIALVLE
jgi:hypothetical protein